MSRPVFHRSPYDFKAGGKHDLLRMQILPSAMGSRSEWTHALPLHSTEKDECAETPAMQAVAARINAVINVYGDSAVQPGGGGESLHRFTKEWRRPIGMVHEKHNA
jgi:hypothetical protein